MKESAVFLHISSLPGKYGIGSVGKEAYKFVDWLKECGFTRWEILPLNPAGPANSPYQTNSAFGFNIAFIDLDLLIDDGLLLKSDLRGIKFQKTADSVDYKLVWDTRDQILYKAYKRFNKKEYEFKKVLNDRDYQEYAFYMTMKKHNGNKAWYDWELEYRIFTPTVQEYILKNYYKEYEYYIFTQYIFLKQWRILKKYANNQGIKIVGDIPYYVSYDSVEFYFHPDLFLIGKNNVLDYISGYPKDAFNKKGQRWGNPLYDWSYMKVNNYKWWNARIARALDLYDCVRMNHFSGFYQFYAMPFSFMDNGKGFFMDGPRLDFIKDKKKLPLIAAGIGIKNDGVTKFIKESGYPDLRIILFGLTNNEENNIHNPLLYNEDCIAYSSNHDTETLRAFVRRNYNNDDVIERISYIASKYNMVYEPEKKSLRYIFDLIIKILYKSNCSCIVLPMQDILYQDNRSRMNTPGTTLKENWCYRILKSDLDFKTINNALKEINHVYIK